MPSRIENFMHGEVRKYLVPDIQRLVEMRPCGPEGLASCAIPEAMLLFVITDLFGFLVRTDSKKPKLDDTKANLKAIFSHELTCFSADYLTRIDTLTGLFRHGLMHQIFPKAAGIRKAGADKVLFEHFDGLSHLNVDRFAADVMNMLESIDNGLSELKWAPLNAQMSQRLDYLSEKDFLEMAYKRKDERLHTVEPHLLPASNRRARNRL